TGERHVQDRSGILRTDARRFPRPYVQGSSVSSRTREPWERHGGEKRRTAFAWAAALRYLLDTCAFIWVAEGGPLSSRVVDVVRSTDNDLFLSAASCWEIATKHAQGRLPVDGPLDQVVPHAREIHGIFPLPIDEQSALRSGRLPWLHRDPFDR